MTVTLPLTEDQANQLAALLDVAVRAEGLKVVEPAAGLMAVLRAAVEAAKAQPQPAGGV